MSGSYRDLIVWQKAFDLSVGIYKLTRDFPTDERYGLSSQLRRASVSIPSNLAEGYGRGSRRDYRNFVAIARGSVLELQTQLAIAEELGFGKTALMREVQEKADEVGKMLWSLFQKL
ncbi:MAG TPA: four helix bundle protein [Acidobacteriaceae bacterium]|jgi:four helix bundle protein|nr:four helix bundle protein [Acidobacteriaceae bacterium]